MRILRYRELKQCAQEDTTKEQESELPAQVGWKTSVRNNCTLLPALSHGEVGEKRPAGTFLSLVFVLFLQGASIDSFWVFNMLLLANLNQVPGQFFSREPERETAAFSFVGARDAQEVMGASTEF